MRDDNYDFSYDKTLCMKKKSAECRRERLKKLPNGNGEDII